MPKIFVEANNETKECKIKFEGSYAELLAMIAVLIDDIAEKVEADPLEVLYHLTDMYDIEEEE